MIPSGKDNPLGTRWVGLSQKGYGIHGTNAPKSIGHAASHGCIRLRNRDMEKLFTMLRVGDVVQIRGERDDEVAQVFGEYERSGGRGTEQEAGSRSASGFGIGLSASGFGQAFDVRLCLLDRGLGVGS